MQTDRKTQGPGYRKGHKVTISKWKHSFYKWRAQWIEEGKPKDKGFKTKTAAEEWAEKKANESLKQGTEETLSHAERSTVIDTRKRIEALGVDLRAVIDLGLEHLERAQKSCTVSELIELHIKNTKRAGRGKRHLDDLKQKLSRFAKTFGAGPVASVLREDVGEWLHGLEVAPTTKNNYRRILVGLFNEGIDSGYIEANPAQKVKPSKVIESEIETLTPTELSKLLKKAGDNILPAIAICAFAGARRSEIEALDWSQIDLKAGNIRIKAINAKSSRNRLIPIEKNLSAWLKPLAKSSGKVWPVNGRKIFDKTKRLAGFGEPDTETEKEKENGLKLLKPWPDNALRHSYASYWLAHNESADKLALHMGHRGTSLIFSNYRAVVTKESAETYWAIAPEVADNIVEMAS